jgi:hypothetical protein
VISIQSIMLIALGFLSAVLLAMMLAPAYRNRAVRLATQRLKERLPLSEEEVRADKDRLRAEYAITVHKLEMKVDQAKLERARNTIEIHRRDGQISQLEQERTRLLALVDENMNARRVLEQTVADRLPKVEARLNEAKTILFNRDREIADLTQSTKRQREALDEANSINAQQTSEIERLSNALTVRGARNQQSLADPTFEGELALRAEIEALRSKSREQAGLIGRLQAQIGRGALAALPHGAEGRPALNAVSNAGLGGDAGRPLDSAADAGRGLVVVASTDEHRAEHDREVRRLQAKIDDQASELARLKAEVETLTGGETDGALKDSKIALKARLNAAQAQAEQGAETVKRLRAELAATNERLALQGAHFMEQMRRLGAGTLPAAQTRRPAVSQSPKLSLAERVAQGQAATSRPSGGSERAADAATGASPDRVSERVDAAPEVAVAGRREAESPPVEHAAAMENGRRPRLIDRISSLNKT